MGLRVVADLAMQAQMANKNKRIVRVFCDGPAPDTIYLIISEPPIIAGKPGCQWSDGTITQF